jgi:lipooligosaccharide transport system permease protein
VWKKIAAPSILGHLADPVIYMLGLGYGLGSLLPEMGGMSYMAFLAAGTVCYSTMNSASFEALYSGFARMHEQRTWEATSTRRSRSTTSCFGDRLGGEQKSPSGPQLAVICCGLSHSPLTGSFRSRWSPVLASLGLIMTAIARIRLLHVLPRW